MKKDGIEGYKIRIQKKYETTTYTNKRGKTKTRTEYVGTQISYSK